MSVLKSGRNSGFFVCGLLKWLTVSIIHIGENHNSKKQRSRWYLEDSAASFALMLPRQKGCSYLSEGTVIEEEFTLADPQMAVSLFGINDAYLKLIEEGKNVIVSSFGDHVKIKGSQDDVSETKEIFAQLAELLKKALRSAMLTLFRR